MKERGAPGRVPDPSEGSGRVEGYPRRLQPVQGSAPEPNLGGDDAKTLLTEVEVSGLSQTTLYFCPDEVAVPWNC